MSDGPWNDYKAAEPSGGKPWEDYGGAPPAPPPAEPTVGYKEDIGKGIVGGLGRGVTGLAGTFGTLGDLTRAGLTYAGLPKESIDTAAGVIRHIPQLGAFTGPSGSDIQKKVEEYTGKFYEPQTIPGQYASTVAEFAPGALIPGGGAGSVARTIGAKTVNTVVPAVTSETMGQLNKGTAAEPWARAIGGLGGGLAGSKIITPMGPASAAHRADVATLDRAGIPMTAGDRTGNRSLRWMESNAADMPFAGGAGQLAEAPRAGFDRYVTERTFDRNQLRQRGVPDNVNLPDPRVARAGPESLSSEYDRILVNPMQSNPQLQNRMTQAQNEYERLVLPHERTPNVQQTRENIVDRLVQQQGQMAGDEYKAVRSQIGTTAKNVANPQEAHAMREIRNAMDEAMRRGLSPEDARALVLNDRRYANMKQVQDAIDAGQSTGHLSPDKVAQGLKSRGDNQYAAQRGDLDEVTQAATRVLKPLPNSGTAARTGAQQLYSAIPNFVAGGLMGATGAATGGLSGLAAAAIPFIAPRLATSRLGQAYLGNQALPQSARDVIAQVMAEQAASQPSGVERNKRERIRVPVYKE